MAKQYSATWYEEQDAIREEQLNPDSARREQQRLAAIEDGGKDWVIECQNCGSLPTVHPTQLCGPCCFGEAETINGNW